MMEQQERMICFFQYISYVLIQYLQSSGLTNEIRVILEGVYNGFFSLVISDDSIT